MKFDLRSPCKDCPFRSDIKPFLTKARVREIVQQITQNQATFSCHKTVDYSDEDDEDYGDGPHMPQGDEQHCAGALIMLERLDQPNQMMRWMERIGIYDRTKLKMDSSVFKTPLAMVKAQKS